MMTTFEQNKLHSWTDFYNQSPIVLTVKQQSQFKQFYDVLIETNQTTNLTRITSLDDFITKHLMDSLSIAQFIQEHDAQTLIDVGAGGGFPSIPLAMAYPQIKVTALDSTGKKMAAVKLMAEKIGLDNIETITGRAEELALDPLHREMYDVVTARAVASLPILLELCAAYVKPNGHFIAFKTKEALENETYNKEAVETKLGLKLVKTIPSTLNSNLILCQFSKVSSTHKPYPRRFAQIKKAPLT